MKTFAACLVPLGCVACTPKGIVRDYASYSGCPEDRIVVLSMGETNRDNDKYRVSGCGQGVLFYCEKNRCKSPEITIANRHAQQFGCETKSVSVKYLQGGAYQAAGCDHDLTYHCIESDETVLRCVVETADEERKARHHDRDE